MSGHCDDLEGMSGYCNDLEGMSGHCNDLEGMSGYCNDLEGMFGFCVPISHPAVLSDSMAAWGWLFHAYTSDMPGWSYRIHEPQSPSSTF